MNTENTVKIDVTGFMAERFLNLATQNGAMFFDVTRGKDCVRATIYVKHIRYLRKAARQSGCKVRIYERKGPKFTLAKLKKRFMLAGGFLIVAAFMWAFFQYTWIIDITGNEKLSDGYILEMLEGYGVAPGMMRLSSELREIEQQILMDESALSYISLSAKGMVMRVLVSETKAAPEVYDPYRRGDIIAAQDAVVESISVVAGTAMVKPGETVKKGQVLIAGTQNGRWICALGEVAGSVWYQGSAETPLFQENHVKTGRESIFRHFKTPFMYVIISEGDEYEQFHAEVSEVGLLDGLFLGISLITETHQETVAQLAPVPYEEAQKLALEKAYDDLLERIPLGTVPAEVSTGYSVSAANASVIARVSARAVKDIAEAKYYD